MSRLSGRVIRLENKLAGGPAVARIVRLIEAALANEEAHSRLASGELEAMVSRLNDNQLDKLIEEVQAMQRREAAPGNSNDESTAICPGSSAARSP